MPWSAATEDVVNRHIRQHAARSLVGKHCSCPPYCYTRKFQQIIFTLCITLFTLSIFMMYGLGGASWPDFISHYRESTEFELTECTTLSAQNITAVTLFCDCTTMASCTKSYSCYALEASYILDGGTKNAQVFADVASLYNEENAVRGCIYHSEMCYSYDPEDKVAALVALYGTPGTVFECWYSSEHSDHVLLTYTEDELNVGEYIFKLFLPTAVSIFCSLMLICVCMSCGFHYPFHRHPPPSIQDEASGDIPLAPVVHTHSAYPGYAPMETGNLWSTSPGQPGLGQSGVGPGQTTGAPPPPPTYAQAIQQGGVPPPQTQFP